MASSKSQRTILVFKCESSAPAGEVHIELLYDAAPKTCAAMRKLAEAKLFDGCCFYRAEPGFVVQGGMRETTGEKRESPEGKLPLEYKLPNKRGYVTMARWEEPDTATSSFFINLADNGHLDRTGDSGWALGFTVFGRVVKGMEFVEEISALKTTKKGGLKMLVEPIVYETVTVVEE